jgi:hypothetical protein
MRKQTYSVMPSERSSTPPTRPESPAARSVFSEEDCPLDPDSSSAFWRSAPVILLTRNAYGEPLGDPPTEVRSRWTRKSLYVIFTCPYETLSLRPDPVTSRETNRLWEWDVAEVFIRPDDAQIRRYKEFEVSPQGEWVDVDVDLDSPNHEEGWVWTSEMEVASRIDREHKIWNGAMQSVFVNRPSSCHCRKRSAREFLQVVRSRPNVGGLDSNHEAHLSCTRGVWHTSAGQRLDQVARRFAPSAYCGEINSPSAPCAPCALQRRARAGFLPKRQDCSASGH